MVAYQVTRQLLARRRALAAVYAVVLGAAASSARRLPAGTSAPRASAATTLASALFATPTSVGLCCKEIIKQLPLLRKYESAQLILYGCRKKAQALQSERLGWSILSAKSWFKLTAFFSKREQDASPRRSLFFMSKPLL